MFRFAMTAIVALTTAAIAMSYSSMSHVAIDAHSSASVMGDSGGWVPACPVLRSWSTDYENCHNRGPGDPRDEPIGLAAPLPSDAEFAQYVAQCGGQVKVAVTFEQGQCFDVGALAAPRVVNVMSVIANESDDPWSVFQVDLGTCFSANRPLPPHLFAIIGFGAESPLVFEVKGRVSTHLSCCQNCASGG